MSARAKVWRHAPALVLATMLLAATGSPGRCATQAEVEREPYRDPNSAALRSLLFPGWGQHYNGQPNKGTLFTAGVAVGAVFAFQVFDISSSEHGRQFLRGAGLAFMGALWSWSVIDAYVWAPRINRENGYEVNLLLPRELGVRVTLLHVHL